MSRWRGKIDGLEGSGAVIPDELYNALKTRLGKEFKAELVHALSDDSVAFLLVRDSGEAIKVPSTLSRERRRFVFSARLSAVITTVDHGHPEGQRRNRRDIEPCRGLSGMQFETAFFLAGNT